MAALAVRGVAPSRVKWDRTSPVGIRSRRGSSPTVMGHPLRSIESISRSGKDSIATPELSRHTRFPMSNAEYRGEARKESNGKVTMVTRVGVLRYEYLAL